MRFISLFAGIGGMDLGLERAGMTCVAQVEIDPFCQKVLTKLWPEVPKYGDVKTVGRHNLPECDLIAGGFPCQDISYAGKGAGIAEGTRSGLWFEFARIICEIRPAFVLVENVAALLTRGMGDVLGTLAAFGYDAEWEVLPACAFGAPHSRERVFLVAYAGGQSGPRRWMESRDSRTKEAKDAPSFRCKNRLVFEVGTETSTRISRLARAWQCEPTIPRMAYGIPGQLDRLRGLGNAVVPQVAEYIGHCIMQDHKEQLREAA